MGRGGFPANFNFCNCSVVSCSICTCLVDSRGWAGRNEMNERTMEVGGEGAHKFGKRVVRGKTEAETWGLRVREKSY